MSIGAKANLSDGPDLMRSQQEEAGQPSSKRAAEIEQRMQHACRVFARFQLEAFPRFRQEHKAPANAQKSYYSNRKLGGAPQ